MASSTPRQQNDSSQNLLFRFPAFWLLLLCLVVYIRALGGDFVMDDWPVIKENTRITELRHIPDYFTSGVWNNTDWSKEANFTDKQLYRPLFLVTVNVGHHLWGNNPAGYHALNILLHGINTLLVFWLILEFIPRRETSAAFFGAALFAVHPVHVESIAWIAGLTDPLVSFFLLSCFLLHKRHLQSGKSSYAYLALLCYAGGLLSKEVAIFFPFVIATNDLLQHRFRSKRYIPYIALLGGYFLARSAALGQGLDWASFDLQRLPVLFEYFFRYIQLLVAPWPLEFYFDRPGGNWLSVTAGAIVLLVSLLSIYPALRKQSALPLFAFAWFILTLLPALPIALMEKPIFAIRVLYLPSVSLALLASSLYLMPAMQTMGKRVAWCLILILAVISIDESKDWKNDLVFYARASESSPMSSGAMAGLARAYEREGDNTEAVKLYLKAVELPTKEPDRLAFLDSAARILGQSGKTQQSEHYYREILKSDPQRSSAWVGLGNNALARQDNQQAIEFFQKAFQVDPGNFIAPYNLALTYRRIGDIEKAQYFEEIARRIREEN